MQFKSAVKQGNQVTVNFSMTCQFKHRTAEVGHGFRILANLTDDKGNIYAPSSTEVANQKDDMSVTHKFPADTEIPVTYTYDNIATNATSISLLELNLYDTEENTKPSLQLQNIPFELPTSSPLE